MIKDQKVENHVIRAVRLPHQSSTLVMVEAMV